MIIDKLTDKKFTTSKHGIIGKWTKEINHIFYETETLPGSDHRTVRVVVLAKDGQQYYLDEIVLV